MAFNIHHEDFETKSPNNSCYSTPKLSLSKLPNKPIKNNKNHQLATYSTPPIHPTLTIPFQWEEAPGKPKVTKSKASRCLNLPPRLTLLLSEEGKITKMPSPTAVLDGPYVGRSYSSINEATLSNNNKENMMMRSWRWESFKENENNNSNNNNNNNRGVVVKGNFDFSGPLNSTTTSSAYDFSSTHQGKFSRKGSFFNFSSNNSNLLGGIYESFKQAVPWRWRRTKKQKSYLKLSVPTNEK